MSERDQRQTGPRDLRLGIAIARDEFDLVVSDLTESALADALRVEAEVSDNPDLLLAIADALDHPDAPIRLKLVRSKRGKPAPESTFLRDMWIASFVAVNVKDGMKQEAVIAEVQQRLGISRATAMKGLANGRELRELAQYISIYADELRLSDQSK